LAYLDGVSHLLWIHGALGGLMAFGAMIGGATSLATSVAFGLGLLAYGAALAVISVLQIVAGIRIQEYRSRKLGVLACAGALLMAPGCGLVPSVLLAVSGLVILLNSGVRAAFDDIASGMDQREMERIHLPRDDEKFALGYVALVVVLSVVGWCGLGALMSAVETWFQSL
jgi:hypothetical protein